MPLSKFIFIFIHLDLDLAARQILIEMYAKVTKISSRK